MHARTRHQRFELLVYRLPSIGVAGIGMLVASCAKIKELPVPIVNAPRPVTVDDRIPFTQRSGEQSIASIARARSAVMDFTDDFTVSLSEAIDAIEGDLDSKESRIAAHKLKYTVAHGATVIAASANPRVALLDMFVMISLQRTMIERELSPRVLGEAAASRVLTTFEAGEARIRQIAAESFTQEQMAEIEGLMEAWLAANPDRRYAAYVRLDEFAAARTMSLVRPDGRTQSLFGLMFVDPLAGLDPATRELEQSRRLAERAMFFLQRMPQLVAWQAELLYLDTATEPETVQILRDVERITDSVEVATRELEALRGEWPDLLARERQATIDQSFDRLAQERKAALDDLAMRGKEIEGTLATLQRTIESGRGLASEATALTESVDRLRAAFQGPAVNVGSQDAEDAARGRSSTPSESTPSPTLEDYQATLVQASSLASELRSLVAATESIATSDAWELRRNDLNAAADDVETRTLRLLDRADQRVQTLSTEVNSMGREMIELAFKRGMALIAMLVGGVLVCIVALKLLPRRA